MALRIVIGDVTIGIQGQDFAYIFSVGMGGMESYIRMAKSGCTGLPDRLSGGQPRTTTEVMALFSAVRSGLRRIVLCAV